MYNKVLKPGMLCKRGPRNLIRNYRGIPKLFGRFLAERIEPSIQVIIWSTQDKSTTTHLLELICSAFRDYSV